MKNKNLLDISDKLNEVKNLLHFLAETLGQIPSQNEFVLSCEAGSGLCHFIYYLTDKADETAQMLDEELNS